MSRNQAKFFIRKRRLSVDGKMVTDPNYELSENSHVIFDGKRISIAGYHYIVLHKPASYVCKTKDTEFTSIVELINSRTEDRTYYFANSLGPEQTGLVLFTDDARWANRMRKKLSKKTCVYMVNMKSVISEDQFRQIKKASVAASDSQIGATIGVQRQDERSLLLLLNQVRLQEILDILCSMELAIQTIRLQKLGLLSLGDLKEGHYLELYENEIKV